jgi:hypothetical protein
VNLFLLTLRSTLTVTVTFWDAWEKMCDKKNQNFGATTTGSFIMTTRPPTCPLKPQSLWLTTTWLSFPILPTRCLVPFDFALFPKLKMKLKGRRFESVWHPNGIASGTRQNYKNDFHGAFEAWEKTMGSLYTFPMFPRRLFWRKWQPKLSKLSQHFVFDLVRELSDRISYSLIIFIYNPLSIFC